MYETRQGYYAIETNIGTEFIPRWLVGELPLEDGT